MWDPAVYRRFAAERGRPFVDLLARVGADRPRAIVDLGCGPGEHTATLADRWPDAAVIGVDSSPKMIDRARRVAAATDSPSDVQIDFRIDFRVGDVADWAPAPETDVVVCNAVLQWVPEHRRLLARWARQLPSGAWLAMQVPGNFDAPSHRALRAVAASPAFAPVVGGLARVAPVDDPIGYAALLRAAGCDVDAWETTYLHQLPADGPVGGAAGGWAAGGWAAAGGAAGGGAAGGGAAGGSAAGGGAAHPVLRWMEGTALLPFRGALDDAGWQAFREALGERLQRAYPAQDGVVYFPFRRVFVVGVVRD
jgi:trans-aconitate 2-methyltransferase